MSAEGAEDIETRLVLAGIFARYGHHLRDYEPTWMMPAGTQGFREFERSAQIYRRGQT